MDDKCFVPGALVLLSASRRPPALFAKALYSTAYRAMDRGESVGHFVSRMLPIGSELPLTGGERVTKDGPHRKALTRIACDALDDIGARG